MRAHNLFIVLGTISKPLGLPFDLVLQKSFINNFSFYFLIYSISSGTFQSSMGYFQLPIFLSKIFISLSSCKEKLYVVVVFVVVFLVTSLLCVSEL